MKSLKLLWNTLADELGEVCGVSTTEDVKTVLRRVEGQGLSFLAIDLPAYCKDFERGLDDEQVNPDLFPGFRRRGRTPIFLGGFLDLIFDRASGRMLEEPNIEAIRAVRQLTLPFGKMEIEAPKDAYEAAMRGFIECEREVRRHDMGRADSKTDQFRQMSRLLWGGVLQRVNEILWLEEGYDSAFGRGGPYLHPKHGPGATADRLRGNEKFDLSEWPQRLEEVFPYGEYVLPNWRHNSCLDRVHFPEPGSERPVRVVAVPKTLKAPRIIAIEPAAMQYMQQAVAEVVVKTIQGDPLMGRMVGFDDQWRNRQLAEEGSRDGALATLDLSEASDRVSNQLVRAMVDRYPCLFKALDATRSRKADVDGHGIVSLAKYASMGSALTFPVEAMVFATIVFIGVERALARPLTRSDVNRIKSQVRVYGDDIIVPVEFATAVVSTLEDFGLQVNRRKSFWTGKFRESCGREYYAGHDVSVVRVRKVVVRKNGALEFPTSLRHVQEIESYVALRNKFYLAGLWRTAAWLDDRIASLLKGNYPVVEVKDADPEEESQSRSRLLGRWSFLGYQPERTHPKLHSPLVRGYVVSSRIPKSNISGVGALRKVLSKRGDEPFADKKHLERAGRPDAVYIKLRWASPF